MKSKKGNIDILTNKIERNCILLSLISFHKLGERSREIYRLFYDIFVCFLFQIVLMLFAFLGRK